MHYSIIVFLVLAVSGFGELVKYTSNSPITWPKKYAVEVTKISLKDGLTEEIKMWRTRNMSRIDYNNGAVKSFSISGKKHSENKYGVKYEIHPETTEEVNNEMVCKKLVGTKLHRIKLETVLPKAMEEYKLIGVDTLREGNYSKFYYEEVSETKECYTLTVKYDEDEVTTIPVRLEIIEYDTWLESTKNHEVWEFHNFETDFDEDVFDASEYDCEDSARTYFLKDKEVTESLLFLDPKNEEHVNHAFEVFKRKHGRVYANDKEGAMRKSIFQKNMRLVATINRQNLGYKLSINKFSDRTPEELKRYRGLKRRNENEAGTITFPYTEKEVRQIAETLPKYFDARMLGLVTPVRDQKDCGSCWTFGTTSAVEGALARSNGGRLLRLSNQALIDCAWGFGAEGCDGGSDTAAYKWITIHGMPTEEEYGTYVNKDGFCRIDNMTNVFKIRGFTDVTPFSVDALKVAVVNHGPLSVSIHVSEAISQYSSGILYDPTCDPTNLNHEVTLVGYGEKDGETYWIVKNSWGKDWGIDGYFHITVRDNNCGVASEPTYPVF